MEEKQKHSVEGVMVEFYILHLILTNSSVITAGWTKVEVNLADYVASKGYVGP